MRKSLSSRRRSPATTILPVNDNDDKDIPTIAHTTFFRFLPPPFRNLSRFECSPAWNGLAFRYFQGINNVTTIVLSGKYTSGWVGIGFSTDGAMYGSSALAGWIREDGKGDMKQYFLGGYTPPEVIPDKGQLKLTTVPPVLLLHGKEIYLAFQLDFAAPLQHENIILAYAVAPPMHNRLHIHDDRTSMQIDFHEDSSRYSRSISYKSLKTLKWGHGLSGMIIYDDMRSDFQFHRAIGFLVLGLSILQVSALIIRPNKESKARKFWKWNHHWMGRFALFFGVMNIFVGIGRSEGTNLKTGYGILLGIVGAITFVLEILLRSTCSQMPEEAAVLS
ncbi:hypothetical protein L1049_023096 [Liquidambar formosana]|uniref:DOMON domain-containing protein n=1 Tax=Liquidambar formosana TaxID=63359 RepID=A0AAP0RF13_LIQFO